MREAGTAGNKQLESSSRKLELPVVKDGSHGDVCTWPMARLPVFEPYTQDEKLAEEVINNLSHLLRSWSFLWSTMVDMVMFVPDWWHAHQCLNFADRVRSWCRRWWTTGVRWRSGGRRGPLETCRVWLSCCSPKCCWSTARWETTPSPLLPQFPPPFPGTLILLLTKVLLVDSKVRNNPAAPLPHLHPFKCL